MSQSKPLIQRLDSPRKMYPHLKWQRSALTSLKHTEEVNELSPTRLGQPVRSSQLLLLQRLNSPRLSSMIPSEPILACLNSMTDLLQTHGIAKEREPEMEENFAFGSKRAASLGTSNAMGKKPKQDDTEFPWSIREQISDSHLGDSLESMLELLRIFAQDLKFTKLSVINSAHAPPFLHLEWLNIIMGSMVNLNHIISGSFAVTMITKRSSSSEGWNSNSGLQKLSNKLRHQVTGLSPGESTQMLQSMFSPTRKRNLTHMAPASYPYSQQPLPVPILPSSISTGVSEPVLVNAGASYLQTNLHLKTSNSIGSTQLVLVDNRQLKHTEVRKRRGQITATMNCVSNGTYECTKKASECRHKHVC